MTKICYLDEDGVQRERDMTPEEEAQRLADIAAAQVPVVPVAISPRQFRQSLTHYGFRQQVDSAVSASSDQDLKDWYQFATEFERNHPEVLAMATALGFTSGQLDQVWTYGASI
jgi:hypothetical protein